MTDSIDKKSKEKTNLDVDLDAMLDDAESSLAPINEFQDDEDALDRLLMDVGFDSDDELLQPEVKDGDAVNDIGLHDDLDEFLGFDSSGGGFDQPEKPQVVVEPKQAVEEFSLTLPDKHQDDEDAIDRLLMNAEVDGEPMPVSDDINAFEELDEFSDFRDFNEPDIAPVLETDKPEAVVAEIEESGVDAVDTDEEPDEFLDFSDFNESDIVPILEVDEPEAAVAEIEEPSIEEPGVEDVVVDTDDGLDEFSDFSDFNELDMISVEIDEPEQDTEDLSESVAAGLPDEIDDFSGLGDGFDETGMIQDDEIDALPLAETNLTAADTQQQSAVSESLNDLQGDENDIDDLLTDSGFDSEDVLAQVDGKKDELLGDDVDLSEISDIFQLDGENEGFSRETEENLLAEITQSAQDEDDFLLPDFDITADMEISDAESNAGLKEGDLAAAFSNADFLNDDNETVQAFEPERTELKPEGDEAVLDSQPEQDVGVAVEDIKNENVSPVGLDQEDIKKQLEDAENKVKKAKRISYAALGFGAATLSAAAGLGVMTYSAKSEVSKLTEQVSSLEASLAKNVENNPNEEINAVMNSVVQLNQQVYGFITEMKETPQFPVDLLNNKVSDIVVKQNMVSKALDMLQVKIGGEERKITFKPLVTESAKVEATHEPAPAKEEHVHDITPNKIEAVKEHAPAKAEPAKEGVVKAHTATKEQAAHDVIAPVKEKAKQEVTPAKVETAPEPVPAKAKPQSEAVSASPIVPPKAVAKEEPVQASKPTAIDGKWGVNLVAFKQEWFAKSKAAEYARLGVIAEVIPVHERNSTMYRLRVGGFKSKAEAFANTDRIKKVLDLDSVWVSDN